MMFAMGSDVKDWIQAASWVGAVIGIFVAIVNYVSTQRHNRRQLELQLDQRKLELRWKQAEAAKKLLDEMLSDPNAKAAMTMLDWSDREFEIAPGVRAKIGKQDYVRALRTDGLGFTEKEAYIRTCFDALFYFMAMMEHNIISELVRLEDVAYPLDYFIAIMNRDREVFTKFLKRYDQDRTLLFIERLEKAKLVVSKSEKLSG